MAAEVEVVPSKRQVKAAEPQILLQWVQKPSGETLVGVCAICCLCGHESTLLDEGLIYGVEMNWQRRGEGHTHLLLAFFA